MTLDWYTDFDEQCRDRWRAWITIMTVAMRGFGFTIERFKQGWHWGLHEPSVQVHETGYAFTLWLWWPVSLNVVLATYVEPRATPHGNENG